MQKPGQPGFCHFWPLLRLETLPHHTEVSQHRS
jgi:hypothetical protein